MKTKLTIILLILKIMKRYILSAILIFLCVNVFSQNHVISIGEIDAYSKTELQTSGQSNIDYRNIINSPDNLSYGREYLKNYDAAISKIDGATSQPSIVFLGDSWTSEGTYVSTVSSYLKNLYGFAGYGYIGFEGSTPLPYGITRVKTGSEWIDSTNADYGLSLSHISSSTIGNYITLTARTTQIIIHYVKKPGGGDFTWAVDGEGATTINTVNSTTEMGYVTISSLSVTALHSLVLTVTNAGTTGVDLCGADFRYTDTTYPDGVRINNLGISGSTTVTWTHPNDIAWESALDTLNPNLIVIMLGVNDVAADRPLTTFYNNISTLINRIKTATPGVSIILMSQADIDIIYTNSMDKYVAKLLDLAIADTIGFLNNYKYINDYDIGTSNGLYANANHLSTYGYNILARNLISFLLKNRPLPSSVLVFKNPLDNHSLSIGGTNFTSATTGYANIFMGWLTGNAITTGGSNIAIGDAAMYRTTTSSNGVAIGGNALQAQTTGAGNTAIGYSALYSKNTGTNNTGIGAYSLYNITTGSNNTAIGLNSGNTVTLAAANNTFLGSTAGNNASQKVDAINSMALGYGSYTTASNQVVVGNNDVTETILRGSVTMGSVLKLTPQADSPSTPSLGWIYVDTDTHIYFYNGTGWIQLDN